MSDDDDHDFWHGLSAAKGEPYTVDEWQDRVVQLERQIEDARRRLLSAHKSGHCLAERFA